MRRRIGPNRREEVEAQVVDESLLGQVVGREVELAAVASFLDQEAVAPCALVIEGEAGVGKTTVVRVALIEASSRGLRVFRAQPAAGEAELPYAALGDLFASVRLDLLAALSRAQRTAVEAALARERAAVDVHALSRGVLELLRLEGEDGMLVVAVDDVQWLDRPTAGVLSFVLRRLGSVPLRALVAVRTDSGPSEPPLGLGDWEHVRSVAVGPLSTTELGALLELRLGLRLARPRLEELSRVSAGNPLFALELARQADKDGATDGAVTLPVALERRLRLLDSPTRNAVATAAAALRPSPGLLLRAGVERGELRSAVEAGVLESKSEQLSFAHPLLATAAYALLLPDERREIHARLAAASDDVVERGHHVARSAVGPDDAAARILDEAARAAAAVGDHASAAASLIRAAELSSEPESETSQLREVRAAVELALAGEVERAGALVRSLLGRLGPGPARAQARLVFFDVAIGPGLSYDVVLSEYALALDDAEADDSMSAVIQLLLAELNGGLGRFERALHHLGEAFALAERAGSTAVQAEALGYVGFFGYVLGRDSIDAARRGVALWSEELVPNAGYSPRMALAEACLYATEFGEAERLYLDEIAAAEEHGLEIVEVMARAHLAEAQTRGGRWSDAFRNGRLAAEHARQAANAQVVAGVAYPLATIEALLGHEEAARARATEALTAAEAIHDFWTSITNRSVLGLVAAAEDDPNAAVEALEPAWSSMLESDLGDLSVFAVAQVLAEAYTALGRVEDALAVARALRDSPGGARPWSRAMAARCEALVASARGDHVAAREGMIAALEVFDVLREPFEHARTLHLLGRVERSARNWGAARAALVEALERFDALGAPRWAEKTAADIARLPGRRPQDRRELTTREREVADLVATGLSNKEVAARLFVSLRTVEATLSKVYAKLGVRSRTELTSRLSRADGS